MASVTSVEDECPLDLVEVVNFMGQTFNPWLGYDDILQEGTLRRLKDNATGPGITSGLTQESSNSETFDCVHTTLISGGNDPTLFPYADCSDLRSYICEVGEKD